MNSFESACDGSGKLVLVAGESGIGKTSLFRKFAQRQKSYTDFMLAELCLSYLEEDSGSALFSQISAQSGTGVSNTAEAIAALRAMSEKAPVIFFVDNANCACSNTADSLLAIAQSIKQEPCKIMMVVSYASLRNIDSVARTESPDAEFMKRLKDFRSLGPDFVTELALQPLKLAEVAMLIYRQFADSNFPSDFANSLHKHTAGLPLFIAEALNFMIQEGTITQQDGAWVMGSSEFPRLPQSLPALVAERARCMENYMAGICRLADGEISATAANAMLSIRDVSLCHIVVDYPAMEALLSMASAAKDLPQDKPNNKIASDCADEIAKVYSKNSSSAINIEEVSDEELSAKLCEMAATAESHCQNYQMRQAADIADNALKLIDASQGQGVNPTNEKRFKLLAIKEYATCWLGFYEDSIAMAKQLEELSETDEQKMTALFRIGVNNYFLNYFSQSTSNINSAIEIALTLGDKASAIKFSNYLGLVGISSFNLELAADALSKGAAMIDDCDSLSQEIRLLKAENLLNSGILARYKLDYKKSHELLEKSLPMLLECNNKMLIAKNYNNIGLLYDEEDNYDKAEEFLQKAMDIDIELNDNVNLSNRYNNFGLLKASYGYMDEAMDYYQKSLKIDEYLNNRPKLAISYDNIGDLALKTGRNDEAKDYFEKALEIQRSLDNDHGIGLAYVNLGNFYFVTEDFDKAREYFQLSAEIDLKYDEKQNIISDYHMIGNTYCQQGNMDEGLSYFNKALQVCQETGDKTNQAALYNNFGNIYFTHNDFDSALQFYKNALMLNKELGDKMAQSLNYNNLASINDKLGNSKEAIANYKSAIKLDREIGDDYQIATHLDALASTYFNSYQYAKARECFNESAKLYGELQKISLMTSAMRNAADALRCEGKYTSAENKLKEAMKISKDNGDTFGEGVALIFLAALENDRGTFKKALEHYKQAAEIFKKDDSSDCKHNYMLCINGIAFCYESLGNMEDALLNHFAVLNLCQAAGDKQKITDKYIDIANIYLAQKDLDTAEKYFRQSVETADSSDSAELKASCYVKVGQFLMAKNQHSEAINLIGNAINLIKDMPELNSDIAKYYTLLADSLYTAKDYEHAIYSYLKAANIYDDMGDLEKKAYVYNNIGYTFDTMSRFKEAIKYYKEAYSTYKQADNIDGVINNLKNVALMYERLEDFKSAATYYRRVLDQLEDLEVPSEKGETALDIAENCMKGYSDYVESAKFVDKAYSYFKEADDLAEQIHCLEILSLLYYANNNEKMGNEVLHKLEQQSIYTNDDDIKIQILKSVGVIKFHTQKHSECIAKFFEAFDINVNRDAWAELGENYYELASVLVSDIAEYQTEATFRGETKSLRQFALDYYANAIKIARTEKNTKLLERALESRAQLSATLNDFDRFADDYDEALSLVDHNSQRYVIALLGKGEVLLRTFKDFAMAEHCFMLAQQKASELRIVDMHALASAYIALLYFMTNRADLAKKILNDVKAHYEFVIHSIPDLAKFI